MKRTIVEIITTLFIILFLYTGISKLMDYSVFKEQLATSPILAPISYIVAILLPWVEFAIVLLLIIPRWRLRGLYSSFVLMILFTLYITGILTFSDQLPCSCGGIIELMSWKQHIIFNSLFIAMAFWGIRIQRHLLKQQKAAFQITHTNWSISPGK